MVAHKKLLNNFDLNFSDMKAHFSVFALQKALEKAKEAGRKERALCRQREQTSLAEQINLDLTYSVSTVSCLIGSFLNADNQLAESYY